MSGFHVISDYVWLEQVNARYFRLSQVRSGLVWIGQVNSGYFILGQVMSRADNLVYVTSA
jgi:hypothetical protein